MAYIESKGNMDIVHLEGSDIMVSKMRCPNCQSTISIKSSNKWLSTKCKCQCALVYPESYLAGRMDRITLERHQKKQEHENEQRIVEKRV